MQIDGQYFSQGDIDWIHHPNLIPRILSRVAGMPLNAWQPCNHYRPALLKTVVEMPRFTGAGDQVANGTCVGRTLGDRRYTAGRPVKTVWPYPLQRRLTEVLCR